MKNGLFRNDLYSIIALPILATKQVQQYMGEWYRNIPSVP